MSKTIYFIRHAESEYNRYKAALSTWLLCKCWCCCDPGLYDPDVSPHGEKQLTTLRERVLREKLNEETEVVIYSPLQRAIKTMLAAFPDDSVPRVVDPACREVMDTTGDIGKNKQDLYQSFPSLDFSSLEDNWWYYDQTKGPNVAVDEPRANLMKRCEDFKATLNARDEKVIAVVSHSMFIKTISYTQSKLPNCGIMQCTLAADGTLTRVS